MNIIGLDTTTHSFNLALVRNDTVLEEINTEDETYHSEDFIVYLSDLLKRHNMGKDDIDGYAISSGPGSLTGIRVGFAFLKGIGFSQGKPIVPVKTLYAIAFEFRHKSKLVCPVIATIRDKVFSALYRFRTTFLESRQMLEPSSKNTYMGETVIKQKYLDINEAISMLPEEDILFVGNGAEHYKKQITEFFKRAEFSGGSIKHPNASTIAMIGLRKIQKGIVPDLENLKPDYV